jgi:hypothetical protein
MIRTRVLHLSWPRAAIGGHHRNGNDRLRDGDPGGSGLLSSVAAAALVPQSKTQGPAIIVMAGPCAL